MALHTRDMDNLPTTAAQLHVAVRQACVPWGLLGLGLRYKACHVEYVLSSLRLVFTLTIKPTLYNAIDPFYRITEFEKFSMSTLLLWTLFFDTCYSGTPDTTAHCLHRPGKSHWRCYSRTSDFGIETHYTRPWPHSGIGVSSSSDDW